MIFALLLFSCKKEKQSQVNSACNENFKINSFEIFERVADTSLPTDVALTSSAILFKASEKYDSVKWTIGNDARVFKTKELSLIFDNPDIITVTLIGSINKKYQCFSKSSDTVVRQLEIRDVRNSALPGRYEGIRLSSPNDTFTLRINQVNEPTWHTDYFIYNFPNTCIVWSPPYPNNTGYLISAGAKNFRIRKDLPAIQECLFEVYGVGRLLNNDSLLLDFEYRTSQNSPMLTKDKFIGKKL